MLFEDKIYNMDNYKSQIQKYALCCDDFNDGVYRSPKEKALLKKYIGFNNRSFVNGFVFDIDHDNGAIAWDLVGLPKPNTIIQNTKNGHAHLLYALKSPVLKTDSARIKPLKLASIVQCGFTERLNANRAYADILMKNPLNTHKWRTTWTDTKAYDLDYLAEFVPDTIKTKSKLKGEIYGLGRNVNLFEDLRKIAYKDILKYKPNKTYDDFYHAMFSMAIMLNNHCNPTEPLSNNEIKQVCQSICKWTWRNFSQEQFSAIQAKRGTKNTGKKKNTKEKIRLEKALEILL
ncbi:TPA_asm: replication protein [Salmonella enterica subsp. houtenae serovar 45:g,z51:-]|uniref:Replication protein n=2 Tax=Salmonella enterica TaxID=28901 RepID=A0A701UN97_SALHO|nr:replication protein [Salmonella enterica subsp. houtenae serovar 45:g,z51:-]HAE3152935.1 replication protein [Salmonella enterica subsp. houtenae serovar 50:g,z51:-]HAE7575730.1 replication protein [Salmonella enterica subsp. houtenae serovar 48:g,z51:-]